MSSVDANPGRGYRTVSVRTESSEGHDGPLTSQDDCYQDLLVTAIVTDDTDEPMPDVEGKPNGGNVDGAGPVAKVKLEDPDSQFLWDAIQGSMIELSDSEDELEDEDEAERGNKSHVSPTDDDTVVEISALEGGSPVRIKEEVVATKVNWNEMQDGTIMLFDENDQDTLMLEEGSRTPIKQEKEDVEFLWSKMPDEVIEIVDSDDEENTKFTTPNLGNSLLRKLGQNRRTHGDPERMRRIQQLYAAKALEGRRPVSGAGGIFTVPKVASTTKTDGANSRNSFAETRRIYKAKRKAKKTTLEDDIAFNKARDKELARIRRLEEDLAKEVNSEEEAEESDDGLFLPEGGQHTSSSKRPYMDLLVDQDDEDVDQQESSDPKKPKIRNPVKRPRKDLNRELKFNFLAGFEEVLARHKTKERLKRQKVCKTSKTKDKGGKGKKSDPNSRQTGKLLNGEQPGGKRRGRKRPILSNIKSLTTSNIYNDANANLDIGNIPAMTGRRKKDAMANLIAAIPIESKAEGLSNSSDRASIQKATEILGKCTVTQEAVAGKGAWDLKGMVTPLYHHQVQGTSKMKTRETGDDSPFGGILADEMGLGKTLMAIATMVTHPPPATAQHRCTLIVCSPAIINQWDNEINKHTGAKTFGPVIKHYGQHKISNKGASGRGAVTLMERVDIVLTTYSEVMRSYPVCKIPNDIKDPKLQQEWWFNEWEAKRGLLHRVHFYRIVLDEAQVIKNYRTATSIACRALMGRHRWAVTGTPIQNSIEEFFPYFKFLQVKYTGSFLIFQKNFCLQKGSNVTDQRLHAFLEKIMIRRTHQDKILGRKIVDLPKNTQTTIKLEFNAVEKVLYDVINRRFIQAINRASQIGKLEESKMVLRKFVRLRQMTSHLFMVQEVLERIFEIEDIERLWAATTLEDSPDSGNATDMMKAIRSMIAAKDDETDIDFDVDKVKVSRKDAREQGSELIFKFRNYLRQLRRGKKWKALVERSNCHKCELPPDEPILTSCYHLYCKDCLIAMAYEASAKGEDCTRCVKCEAPFESSSPCPAMEELGAEFILSPEADQARDANGKKQRPQRTVKDQMRWCDLGGNILPSTKSAAVQGQIEEWLRDYPTTKIIVFSQFHLFMNVLGKECENKGWKYCTYHGKMSHKHREEAVEKFNDDPEVMIMIASLKCGGIGLNLTIAKRVICVDLWFNSSVEQQAFCRVFRIGQDEETFITRFVVKDTVDEKLLEMQLRKDKSIGAAMDDRSVLSKLTLVELMALFGEVKHDDNDIPFIYVEEDHEIEALIPRLAELDQDDGA